MRPSNSSSGILRGSLTETGMISGQVRRLIPISSPKWNTTLRCFGSRSRPMRLHLVSAASPYDQFAAGNKNALTTIQAQGLNIFTGKGQCTNCHTGPEFTAAAFTTVNRAGPVQSLSNGLNTDTGYFHTGVRPNSDDMGLANTDGFGNPLSIATQQNPS